MAQFRFNVNPAERDFLKNLVIFHDLIDDESKAVELKREILNWFTFTHKTTDLLSLSQTCDLESMTSKPPLVTNFTNLMNNEMAKFVKQAFCINEITKISMSISCYNKGDYLLCHDDVYEDRIVAFVFYLTENWTEEDGGALRFFSYIEDEPLTDEYDKILIPKFNSMVLFQVSNMSHHEVEQVFSNKSRLAISGWFHSQSIQNSYKYEGPLFKMGELMSFTDFQEDVNLQEMVTPEYLMKMTRKDLCSQFKMYPFMLAQNVLLDSFYESCVNDLTASIWDLRGPPQYRRCEAMSVIHEDQKIKLVTRVVSREEQIESNLPHLHKLIKMLISPSWLAFLNEITGGMELAVLDYETVPPLCFGEIQRWSEGSYSLLCDNEFSQKLPTLDVTIFFEVNHAILNKHVDGFSSDIMVQNIGEAVEQFHMNGKIVRSSEAQMCIKHYKALRQAKLLRHFRTKIYEKRRLGKVFQAKGERESKISKSHLLNKKEVAYVRKIVGHKLNIIKNFRQLLEIQHQHAVIEPESNAMYIGYNSKKYHKFNFYMNRTKKEGPPNIGYYSVTVSYSMASKWKG